MAKFEKMIPFILHFAAGVAPEYRNLSLEKQFELARKTGWSDDPDDPGGATMIDVTLATYLTYRKRKLSKRGSAAYSKANIENTVSLRGNGKTSSGDTDISKGKDEGVIGKAELHDITFGEWKEILKLHFWDAWRADEINAPGIAHILVDWIWASGPKTIRNVQRILGVKADGIVGPLTLAAINQSDPEKLFRNLKGARIVYYGNCSGAWKYLRGWLRRLNAINPDGSFSY